MFHVLHPSDQRKGAIATVEFEGKPYSAGASFFLGDLAPGKGPTLHKHPYSEICVVRSGQARMTVDGTEIVAGRGDIVVIEPETAHEYIAIGYERLDIICIHASDRFIIEWLNY
jgi:quercetin dioxygenase-like cupin family protein